MQCECQSRLNEKILQAVKANLPKGSLEPKAELVNYAFIMNGNSMDTRVFLEFSGEVMVPKRGGGLKKQKIKQKITTAYCPFCGTPAENKDKE
ncbi:hypothetical protein [Marinobacterium stanieri]|uniref:Uncharacterized protein n=1 Tax=Marinobacterium stanieri TaxID=49186 RepID=A0A1N6QDH7_9GAMM|nr:hypothetical protein [Marinobacterium stanieri]SIQ14476.1 hypothetical protein SAMN05421647_102426 [Marinobacterium stanieri]